MEEGEERMDGMGRRKGWGEEEGVEVGRRKGWKEEGVEGGRDGKDLDGGILKTGRQDSHAAPSAAFLLLCRHHCSPPIAAIVVVACNNGDSRRKGIPGERG